MTDTSDERSPYGVAVRLEHRADRGNVAYDEVTPSTICHPNGTRVCSGDRAFTTAALRHIFDLIDRGTTR